MRSLNNHYRVQLDADGDDYGPAPLQDDYIEDETFEGVVNMGNGNIAHSSSAEMAELAIINVINRMRGIQDTIVDQHKSK